MAEENQKGKNRDEEVHAIADSIKDVLTGNNSGNVNNGQQYDEQIQELIRLGQEAIRQNEEEEAQVRDLISAAQASLGNDVQDEQIKELIQLAQQSVGSEEKDQPLSNLFNRATSFLDKNWKPDFEVNIPPVNPFIERENAQPGNSEKSMGELLKEVDNVSVDTAFANNAFNVLSSIKFEDLIGNPLRAAMKAQRDMAKESLNFVKQDVMKTGPDGQGKLTYVTLNFRRDGKEVNMQVPLITLVPYPSLMISQMTYGFTAKIDALSSMVVGVGRDVSMDWGPAAAWSTGNKAPSGGTTPAGAPPQAKATPQAAEKPQQAAAPAADRSQTASNSGDAAAKMATAKTNANTSLGATYASGVEKGSRYNVQTTMDISITANSQEAPKGLTHIINILDQCTEVINSKGELIVSAKQASLTGSVVAINATYRNPIGTYEPAKVTCEPYALDGEKKPRYPQMLPKGDNVMLLFSEKGTYLVSAGSYTEVVIIS